MREDPYTKKVDILRCVFLNYHSKIDPNELVALLLVGRDIFRDQGLPPATIERISKELEIKKVNHERWTNRYTEILKKKVSRSKAKSDSFTVLKANSYMSRLPSEASRERVDLSKLELSDLEEGIPDDE